MLKRPFTSGGRRRLAAISTIPIAVGALAFASGVPASAAPGPVFTVNSTGDAPDSGKNGTCRTAGGVCTLRAAIMEANWTSQPATINFALSGSGVKTIQPGTRLPAIANAGGVVLNGYSQPGSRANTSSTVSNARILIEIKGKGPKSFDGLTVTKDNNVIKGLAIYNFASQIRLTGNDADNNRIVGNFVCTNAAGTWAQGSSSGQMGIFLHNGPSGNAIGTSSAPDRNVVSGCGNRGINFSFLPTVSNRVQGNLIGLAPNGTRALPNQSNAVDINYTSNNLVGGTSPGQGNTISGNRGSGIEDSHGKGNHNNTITGNLIGASPSGGAASYAGNALWGIRFEGPYHCGRTGQANPTGCTDAGVAEGLPHNNTASNNVIVSNRRGGIFVDKGHNRVQILNNYIGVTRAGANAGNNTGGVIVQRGPYGLNISGNRIANSGFAVQISSLGGSPTGKEQRTYDNLISRNSMFNVTTGIQFNYNNANLVQDGIKPPTLVAGSGRKISGKACAGCRVELFVAAGSSVKAGRTYLATATANSSGNYSITLTAASGSRITGVAINSTKDTSQFQAPVTLRS